MLRNVTLIDAFEHIADEDEWQEFCSLGPVNEGDYYVYSMVGYDEERRPYYQNIRRCDQLWSKFSHSLRDKLLKGDWVADGFDPRFGARPVEIGSRLWKDLEIAKFSDRAEGQGYKFVALSFSQVSRVRPAADYRAASSLRRELIRWIENQAKVSPGPMTSPQVLAAARRAFAETKITDTMFKEAWRVAKKPEQFRQRGRPKAKVGGG